MKALALALCVALPAHAELYRWIDPDTGRVKFSTLPPYDPRAKAQVVPYRAPGAPKPPAPPPSAKPKPQADAPAASDAVSSLESRLRELLARLGNPTPQDFDRGGEGLRQRWEAYQAAKEQLDRLDPSGAERRRKEAEGVLERLRQAYAAQFGTTMPVPAAR